MKIQIINNNIVLYLHRIEQLVYKTSSQGGPENVFTESNFIQKLIEHTLHVFMRDKNTLYVI